MGIADLLGQADQMFGGRRKEVASRGLAFSAEDAHRGK